MKRREFLTNAALGTTAAAATGGWSSFAQSPQPSRNDTASSAAGGGEPAFPATPGLTRYVSEFIANTKYDDLPAEGIAHGKNTLLDAFGVGLAGSVSSPATHVRLYLEKGGWLKGEASIWGTSQRAAPRFAALANGISIHADDFDDTGSSLHSSAPLLPAVVAHCEVGRRSGKDLMLAYQIGVEVENRIGDAISPEHKASGFHTAGTCGVFGSTAASAKLLGLAPAVTAMALGIAGSESSGLRRNYGTMTKSFNAGHAAEGGVVAAGLAAAGFTAAPDILEAKLGFFQAYGRSYDPHLIMGRLGNPWMFISPGDMVKRFPCGTIQQPIMDLVLRLMGEHHITAHDVARVEVGGNQRNIETLMRHQPKNGLEAKFSMEFAIAVLLVEGKAGLAQFTDAVVQRPAVQAMISRVRYYRDPQFDKLAAAGADIRPYSWKRASSRFISPTAAPSSASRSPRRGARKIP